jgi:hypothetical protein
MPTGQIVTMPAEQRQKRPIRVADRALVGWVIIILQVPPSDHNQRDHFRCADNQALNAH